MSDFDNSMSINSLMDAIQGINIQPIGEQHSNFIYDFPNFMHTLIKHLQELCITQTAIEHARHQLHPFIVEYMTSRYTNPKPAIQDFFNQYLKLLSVETNKMNTLGKKKLKYLTNTVSKQIFTQIMRMSCDLKLVNINRRKSHQYIHRQNNKLNMLVGAISRCYLRQQEFCFKIMKMGYQREIRRQERFVQNFQHKIDELGAIYSLNRKIGLASVMNKWRKRTIELAKQESEKMSSTFQLFNASLLKGIISTWEKNPKNWHRQLNHHLNILFNDALPKVPHIMVGFVGDQKYQMDENSLFYSNQSSQRSYPSRISAQYQISECMQKDEVKYNNENKSVMIPLVVEETIGVLVIQWENNFPLYYFQLSLKLIQVLKQILAQMIKIGNRLSYHAIEYEENQWQSNLYNLYVSEGSVELSEIEEIFDQIGLTCLEIYHSRTSTKPCISYGSQSAAPFPMNVYEMVWQKVEKCSFFHLERNNINFEITRLGKQSNQGFCRYLFCQQKLRSSGRHIFIQCVVPLVLCHLGNISCEICSIKIKEGKIQNLLSIRQKQSDHSQEIKQLDISSLMLMKHTPSMSQVQECVYRCLKETFEHKYFFCSLFYSVNENSNIYCWCQDNEISSIEVPKSVILENICEYEGLNQGKIWNDFVHVLHSHPLFNNSPLYLYEKEKSKTMKIFPTKIGRKAILVIATYEKCLENKILDSLKLISNILNENQKLFKKTDGLFWASQIYEQHFNLNLPSQASTLSMIDSVHSLSFPDCIQHVRKMLQFPDKILMWKVNEKTKNSSLLNCESSRKSVSLPFFCGFDGPMQSYQRIPGSQKLIRRSKKFGVKIKEHLTYVPQFMNQQLQFKFAKILLQKTDETGESVDSQCNQLTDFLARNSLFQKQHQQWLSIPLHSNNQSYLLFIIYPRQKIINQLSLDALINYISQIMTKIIQFKKQSSQTFSSQCLSSTIFPLLKEDKTKNIKNCINKFVLGFKFYEKRKKRLHKTLVNIVQKVQYRFLRHGFQRMSEENKRIREKYERGCQFMINKMKKVLFLSPLIRTLSKMNHKTQATIRLDKSISNLLQKTSYVKRLSLSSSLKELKDYVEIKSVIKQKLKRSAIEKIRQWCDNKEFSNKVELFKQNYIRGQSLKRSLLLIQEQFQIIQPKDLRQCIKFLNHRINLIISQNYSEKISLTLQYLFHEHSLIDTVSSNLHYSFIPNTTFALVCTQPLSHHLVQQILQKILPYWEIAYRQMILKKTKSLSQKIDHIRCKNLKAIFSFHKVFKNKENIDGLNKIKKKVKEEQQEMEKLEKSQNCSDHVENKQNHKQKINEFRQEIGILQGEEQKIGIQMRIKSKTNAAYRMIGFVNKKMSFKNKNKNIDKQKFNELCSQINHKKKQNNMKVGKIVSASINKVLLRAQNRLLADGMWQLSTNLIR